MKHWKLDIIGYWVTGAVYLIKKGPELFRSPPYHSNDFRKILTLLISINCLSLVGECVMVQKIYSKMHPGSCTNTHPDATDLVNRVMIENTKNLNISRTERRWLLNAKDQSNFIGGKKAQLVQKLFFVTTITKLYCQHIWANERRKQPYLESTLYI